MKDDLHLLLHDKYNEYMKEALVFFDSFKDRPDLFNKIGIEYFVDFTNLLQGYGFVEEPSDICQIHYTLNSGHFFYSVSLYGEKLHFRLSYILDNGLRCASELTDRFVNIFERFRCLEEIFFSLTIEIARKSLKDSNKQDMHNLLNRRLIIKDQC
nr:MAG TPA_asm: hypothetical protein [Caudoviricetes sp.]